MMISCDIKCHLARLQNGTQFSRKHLHRDQHSGLELFIVIRQNPAQQTSKIRAETGDPSKVVWSVDFVQHMSRIFYDVAGEISPQCCPSGTQILLLGAL